jgi:hypothetical protein
VRTAALSFKPLAMSVLSSWHRLRREILCQDGSHRRPPECFQTRKTLLDLIFRPVPIETSKFVKVNTHKKRVTLQFGSCLWRASFRRYAIADLCFSCSVSSPCLPCIPWLASRKPRNTRKARRRHRTRGPFFDVNHISKGQRIDRTTAIRLFTS